MTKKNITQYVFTPGIAGAGTIKIPGEYVLEDILLITNVTDNVILYNFASPSFATTSISFTAGNDATNFPRIADREDGFTTITLAANTSSMSSSDKLLIYVEGKENQATSIRPWSFGTDAIERMRVSNPESLIDADFEYGLQPTKWAGFGTIRGYPSAFEIPGVDLTVTAITTDFQTTSTTNSLITVTTSAVHGLAVGGAVNISALNSALTGFSRADGTFIINSVPTTTTLTYFARGTVGASSGQSLLTDATLLKRGGIYSGASIPVASATSNGANPSIITLNFTNPHGLVPGTAIHAIVASGTQAALASGPFVISSVPSLTSLTYTARAGAIVVSPATVTLYAMTNATIVHRSADGGVILSTKTPTYGSIVARQSKKYFRYQSGKGFLWSTGTLFRPNYDLRSVTASNTTIGSTITVTTDDIDHGLQIGAGVELSGVTTSGYNGEYVVASITSDFQFTVVSTSVLGATTAVLGMTPKVYVKSWAASAVRAGMFDDQNGLFWEYDGGILSVVRRHSVDQVSGTLAVTANSNAVTGTNTRFTQQLKTGDRIVIRGMTHHVIQVVSDTSMFVSPDYRGVTASGVKGNLINEIRIRQDQFNIDKVDGTGASGFTLNLSKMQMVGMQYSWYGAGFVDFMVRGADGNWVFVHRLKNNNVNDEAYMRSGNLPVRYSIENDSPVTALSGAIDNSVTTIPVTELTHFPTAGTIYIDNEMISYTGKSAATGAGNFTGATRAATLTQWQAGTSSTFSAGAAASHTAGTGIILVSNTCSPTLSHWGSALIMDGGFTRERGYFFNFQRTGLSLTTTNQTAFLIRLAPSVSNSQLGALGVRDLLNRSQLLLQTLQVATSAGSSAGACIVEGVLNPKNLTSATWLPLNAEAQGGQPSLAQVATSVTWASGTFGLPGEQIFAFPTTSAAAAASGAVAGEIQLNDLKELTGSPLGGDGQYPDGSDVLAINIRLTAGTATGHVLLRWSEAQA
jgi:hypothetical protein